MEHSTIRIIECLLDLKTVLKDFEIGNFGWKCMNMAGWKCVNMSGFCCRKALVGHVCFLYK